jgi:beta-lactam-binding protein with PASTA domain
MGIYRTRPYVEGEPVKRLAPILLLVVLALSIAACAPQSSGSGEGDGLHSIVPDVVGLDETEATAALEDAGYVVGGVTTEASDSSEPGTVISQEPIASTSAPRDSEVDLVVAGP